MKKSTTYRQTFRRHRLLLSLPVVIGVLIAGGLTFTSGKSYESSASLWVDNPATTDSSLGNLNPAMTPPSTEEQDVLTELLATPGFDLAVGHQSLLGSYLASHKSGGLGSIVGGGGSLNVQIMTELGTNVTSAIPGPQVLQINYVGPTPAVAQSTLKAIVAQLQQDSSSYAQQHTAGALSYFQAQANTASQELVSARNQADAYRAQHPTATSQSDPNLAALQAAETAAGNSLSQAQGQLSQAKAAVKGGAAATAATVVRTIDAPSLPMGPTTGKKKQVEGILAGLLGGLVVAFLGTIALTRRESDPWEDELAEAAGGTPSPSGIPTSAHAPNPQPELVGASAGHAAGPNGSGLSLLSVDRAPVGHTTDSGGLAHSRPSAGGASSNGGAFMTENPVRSLQGNAVQAFSAQRKFSH